ncbi:hypothetical protein DFR68_104194 [Nocardia mexicana]|uniref:Uncharacterized protein n=1 Tax=Nocardia mexicana TaxID=279262 RepID=A0A370H5L8_9NOCA|nr:hypothetical protein DFR68_104194 [Nocardia mexicana]
MSGAWGVIVPCEGRSEPGLVPAAWVGDRSRLEVPVSGVRGVVAPWGGTSELGVVPGVWVGGRSRLEVPVFAVPGGVACGGRSRPEASAVGVRGGVVSCDGRSRLDASAEVGPVPDGVEPVVADGLCWPTGGLVPGPFCGDVSGVDWAGVSWAAPELVGDTGPSAAVGVEPAPVDGVGDPAVLDGELCCGEPVSLCPGVPPVPCAGPVGDCWGVA